MVMPGKCPEAWEKAMRIDPSPLPGWAWDMIEAVECGERKPDLVREIVWKPTPSIARWDRQIARLGRVRDSTTKARAARNWETRKADDTRYTSGQASPRRHRIIIRAGTAILDQKTTLLHEMAHLLAPYGVYHERPWVKIAARLYIEYGATEVIAWAYAHERRGGEPLKRLLRAHQEKCDECRPRITEVGPIRVNRRLWFRGTSPDPEPFESLE
jgi:hypothetical protein